MHTETTLHIAPDHAAFAGHFPGAPIVPGVVLLDAAVHAMLQMPRPPTAGDAHHRSAGAACRIGAVKFISPVGPGETLTISCTTSAAGSSRFEISSGNRKVATGTLVLVSA